MPTLFNILRTKTWLDPKVRDLEMDVKGFLAYLETGPNSEYWGIYYLPSVLIPHQTMLPPEIIASHFRILQSRDLALYDPVYEVVLAVDHLSCISTINDKQRLGLKRHLLSLGDTPLVGKFIDRNPHLKIEWDRPINSLSIAYGYPIDTKGLGVVGLGSGENTPAETSVPASAGTSPAGDGVSALDLKKASTLKSRVNAEPEGSPSKEPKGEGSGRAVNPTKRLGRTTESKKPPSKAPRTPKPPVDPLDIQHVVDLYEHEIQPYADGEGKKRELAFEYVEKRLKDGNSVDLLCTCSRVFAADGGCKGKVGYRTRCHTFFRGDGLWKNCLDEARALLAEPVKEEVDA